MAKIVPLILQLTGVLILLASNILFYFRSKKYGNLQKGFVQYASAVFAMDNKKSGTLMPMKLSIDSPSLYHSIRITERALLVLL